MSLSNTMLATMIDCRIASSVSSCVGFFSSTNFGVRRAKYTRRQSGTQRSREKEEREREQHTGIKTGDFKVKHNKLCIMWNYYWCVRLLFVCFWCEPRKWPYFISSRSRSPVCIFRVPKPPPAACYICVKYYCEQRMVIICFVSFSWVFRYCVLWTCSRSLPFHPPRQPLTVCCSPLTLQLCASISRLSPFSFFSSSSKQFINAFVLLHIYSNFPTQPPTENALGMIWTLQT